jgi:hypothetical protein
LHVPQKSAKIAGTPNQPLESDGLLFEAQRTLGIEDPGIIV